MILYFLRHGKAEPARDGDDAARQLTAEGEQALASAARLWRRLGVQPDVVITSPLRRAVRTAELTREALQLRARPTSDPALAPGATWARMARALSGHAGARRVMFVGHEPDLSTAVEELSGASSVRLRSGGIACLEFDGVPQPGTGEIAWLLDPSMYHEDGD